MISATYIDHMGSDSGVVNDARISFDNQSEPLDWHPVSLFNPAGQQAMVPSLEAADERLICFLARGCRSGEWEEAVDLISSGHCTRTEAEQLLRWAKKMPTHWTPFGQQHAKMRMKAPLNIKIQCFKHKIGFVENEESRRYIDSTPELFVPEFRSRPEGSIKQGSGSIHPDSSSWEWNYNYQCRGAVALYKDMIADGVAPEQARFVLPQGVYVNWVWNGSLYAWAEFYNKRHDRSHAQAEIADLANKVAEVMEQLFPISWRELTR